MYERIEDRFNALENGIRKYATALFTSGLMRNRWTPQLRDIFSVGMICCDGEGRLNEKVHHAAKQLITSGPFTSTDSLLFEPLTELQAYAGRKLP